MKLLFRHQYAESESSGLSVVAAGSGRYPHPEYNDIAHKYISPAWITRDTYVEEVCQELGRVNARAAAQGQIPRACVGRPASQASRSRPCQRPGLSTEGQGPNGTSPGSDVGEWRDGRCEETTAK